MPDDLREIRNAVILAAVLFVPAGAAWFDFAPAGAQTGQGILADVVSHCDEQGKRTAYEPDKVTYCHEATHMVNSRVRNSVSGNRNAFYVGGGKVAVFSEPRVTLRTISGYVAAEYRNEAYKLYLIDQAAHWDSQPLYVLDEWTAYCNGLQAANELRVDQHGERDRALWFCHYAACLIAAIKERDPNYAELAELSAFVDWQTQRAKLLAGVQ